MTWINKSPDKRDANIRVMLNVRETYRFEKREKEIGNELPKKEIFCQRIKNMKTVMEMINFLFWKFV